LPRFLADPMWGMLTFWMPLYLTTARGFDLKQIALFAWLPFVAADAGCLFGPAVTLWLQRRGLPLIKARKWAFTLGASMMVAMLFVTRVRKPDRRHRLAVARRLRPPDPVDHRHHHVVRPVPQA
jgi:ACS family hexuronate transporter-like MFS transporter